MGKGWEKSTTKWRKKHTRNYVEKFTKIGGPNLKWKMLAKKKHLNGD